MAVATTKGSRQKEKLTTDDAQVMSDSEVMTNSQKMKLIMK